MRATAASSLARRALWPAALRASPLPRAALSPPPTAAGMAARLSLSTAAAAPTVTRTLGRRDASLSSASWLYGAASRRLASVAASAHTWERRPRRGGHLALTVRACAGHAHSGTGRVFGGVLGLASSLSQQARRSCVATPQYCPSRRLPPLRLSLTSPSFPYSLPPLAASLNVTPPHTHTHGPSFPSPPSDGCAHSEGAPYTLTTPLYYVNAAPHMGSAYPTIAADAAARFQRLRGRRVHFITGTDEHGEKIALAAEKAGVAPKAHCDAVAAQYAALWAALDIAPDAFVRTTQAEHEALVTEIMARGAREGGGGGGLFNPHFLRSFPQGRDPVFRMRAVSPPCPPPGPRTRAGGALARLDR